MIKAIETVWRGYRFRSRLEARWAVFFDRMGLAWEYEPEGFEFDGVQYLPDFRVMTPQGEPMWYEVKPVHIKEDRKFSHFRDSLSEQMERSMNEHFEQLMNGVKTSDIFGAVRAEILSGDPVDCLALQVSCPRCSHLLGDVKNSHVSGSEQYYYCWACDMETPSRGEWEKGLKGIPCRSYKGDIITDATHWAMLQVAVLQCAEYARAARFEHGEAPA